VLIGAIISAFNILAIRSGVGKPRS